MKQPARKPPQVKEPPASSYTYTLSWWMTETTMWTTIKVETMVVKYNDQMSHYSTTAKDIFFIVGESESVLNAEDVLVQTFLHVLPLCVDSACIVYQNRSSDAQIIHFLQ